METRKTDVSLVFVDKSVVFTIVIRLWDRNIEKCPSCAQLNRNFTDTCMFLKKTADNPSIFQVMMLQKAKAFGNEKIQLHSYLFIRDIAVLNERYTQVLALPQRQMEYIPTIKIQNILK